MSAPRESIEDLLVRAQAGDEQAADKLLAALVPDLRQAVARESVDERLVVETIDAARQGFGEFNGASKADVMAWLMKIWSHSNPSRDEQPNAPETMAAGKTARAQASDPFQTRIASSSSDHKSDATSKGDDKPDDIHRAATVAAPVDPYATLRPNRDEAAGAPGLDAHETSHKVFGDYEILDTIARGGMGVVYKARQRKLNRIVALKMILAGQFANQADIDRFYVEAEASANLRHPNIVGIHEVGECDGQHYFSMDYIQGQSLAGLVQEHPLPARRAADYVKTIAEAMQYAHEHGILHRDLKPSNVLVDEAGEPLITDFGLAKQTESHSQLTMSGTIVGTPAYMPPEQASGKLDLVSVRSDVYSLGAILYELLTSRPPFVSANPFETIKQVLESEPVSPRLLNRGVPVDLETICLKCLQKEPARRYGSAQELADELYRYLSGEPILARPVGIGERVWRWCKRNPKVALSSAMAASLLLFAAIVFPILYVRAEIAKRETEQALARAEASIDQMRVAIDGLYRIVAEEDLLNAPGFKPIRQRILSQARDLYRQALDRLGNDPKIEEDMAVSLFSLGRILHELEEPEEALEPLLRAQGIQEKLLAATPKNATRAYNLANTVNQIGEVFENQRNLDDALDAFERAIALRQNLVEREPRNVEYRRKLINSQMNSGLIHNRMFELGDESHYEPAKQRLSESQERRHELFGETSQDALLHLDAVMGAYNLARLLFPPLAVLRGQIWELEDEVASLADDPSRTHQQQTRALEISSRLAQLRADSRLAQDRINSQLQNAFEQLDILEADDAVDHLLGYRRLDQFRIRQMRALCLILQTDLAEDVRDAVEVLRQAKQILEELVAANPDTHEFNSTLAGVYMRIGNAYFDVELQEDEKALDAYVHAIGLLQQLVDEFPGVAHYDEQLREARNRLDEMRSVLESAAESPKSEPLHSPAKDDHADRGL